MMNGEDEPIRGDGWKLGRKPTLAEIRVSSSVDHLIPDAPWFWQPLQRFCVPGCCDLEAYDFSPDFVRWVTHQSTDKPERDNWRHDEVGDVGALASELRLGASVLREATESIVWSRRLELYVAPAELADVLEDLAAAIETGE